MIIRQLPSNLHAALTFDEFKRFADTLISELKRQAPMPIHNLALTLLEESQELPRTFEVDLLARHESELERLRETRLTVGAAVDAAHRRNQRESPSREIAARRNQAIRSARDALDQLNRVIDKLRELNEPKEDGADSHLSESISHLSDSLKLRQHFDEVRRKLDPSDVLSRCVGTTSDLVPRLDEQKLLEPFRLGVPLRSAEQEMRVILGPLEALASGSPVEWTEQVEGARLKIIVPLHALFDDLAQLIEAAKPVTSTAQREYEKAKVTADEMKSRATTTAEKLLDADVERTRAGTAMQAAKSEAELAEAIARQDRADQDVADAEADAKQAEDEAEKAATAARSLGANASQLRRDLGGLQVRQELAACVASSLDSTIRRLQELVDKRELWTADHQRIVAALDAHRTNAREELQEFLTTVARNERRRNRVPIGQGALVE